MANRIRGEIAATLDGKSWVLCLTLGALAELEDGLGAGNLGALAQKFSGGNLKSADLLKIITAGLKGGGYELNDEEVAEMRVDGGVSGYVDIAARLLEATFTPLEPEQANPVQEQSALPK